MCYCVNSLSDMEAFYFFPLLQCIASVYLCKCSLESKVTEFKVIYVVAEAMDVTITAYEMCVKLGGGSLRSYPSALND